MWCALYCICLLLIGLGTVSVLMPRAAEESSLLRFGFAACLGPGLAGLGLIAFSMLGWLPRRAMILSMTAPFALVFLISISRGQWRLRLCAGGFRRSTLWLAVICVAALAYAIFAVARDAVANPVIVGDAFSIWQLKAKVLASYPLNPVPSYFFDVALSYSHLRYPILIPMISAGVRAMTGSLDTDLVKVPFFPIYIGLGAAIFGVIKTWRGLGPALAVAAALMTTPIMLAHAANGTADMALTAFYGCSLIAILRWLDSRRAPDLILAFLFTLCMAWSKNEGLPLAVLNAVAIILFAVVPWRGRNRVTAIAFAIVLILLYLPWAIYSRDFPRTDEDYATHLNIASIAAHIDRLPFILYRMGADMVHIRLWGIFWLLPLVAAIFNPRLSRPVLLLWLLLIAHLLIYIPAYMVAPMDLSYLMQYSVSRLLLHATPAAALLLGLQWPKPVDPVPDHLP